MATHKFIFRTEHHLPDFQMELTSEQIQSILRLQSKIVEIGLENRDLEIVGFEVKVPVEFLEEPGDGDAEDDEVPGDIIPTVTVTSTGLLVDIGYIGYDPIHQSQENYDCGFPIATEQLQSLPDKDSVQELEEYAGR